VPYALEPPHFRLGSNRKRLRGRSYRPDKTAVTNIQFQALLASNILATETVVPVLAVSANSSSDEALAFSADTHVGDLSAVTVRMTVQFKDANGNIGSVSNSLTCFGCPE
jgi:hypothetical protein